MDFATLFYRIYRTSYLHRRAYSLSFNCFDEILVVFKRSKTISQTTERDEKTTFCVCDANLSLSQTRLPHETR